MARDYVAEGSCCYHYIRVDKVYSSGEFRYIKGYTKRFFKDLTKRNGYRIDDCAVRVRVSGYLADYVDYEVIPNEVIFVVGHLGASINPETRDVKMIIVADAIMKPDYLKYYKTGEIGER